MDEKRRNVVVTALDPDLAVRKSMSLSVRIGIQKERNFQREIENERTYYDRVLSGFFDD